MWWFGLLQINIGMFANKKCVSQVHQPNQWKTSSRFGEMDARHVGKTVHLFTSVIRCCLPNFMLSIDNLMFAIACCMSNFRSFTALLFFPGQVICRTPNGFTLAAASSCKPETGMKLAVKYLPRKHSWVGDWKTYNSDHTIGAVWILEDAFFGGWFNPMTFWLVRMVKTLMLP